MVFHKSNHRIINLWARRNGAFSYFRRTTLLVKVMSTETGQGCAIRLEWMLQNC